MSTGTFYPGVSGDDGYGYPIGSNFYSSFDYITIGSTDRIAFFRFPNVTIPQGASISAAFIRLTAYNEGGNSVNVDIQANDVDTAVAPTSWAELSGLTLTTAKVDWNINAAWTQDTQYDSVSITSVIQEVVNRVGWASGSAMTIVILDDSAATNKNVRSIDYDSGSAKAELHITWTETNINVHATTAALTITGNAATISYDLDISAASVALSLATLPATIFPDILVEAKTATLTLTAHRAIFNVEVACTSVSLTLATHQAAVNLFLHVPAGVATLTLTVYDADVDVSSSTVTITETPFIFETIGWGWIKALSSTAEITDTVDVSVGIPIVDVLTAEDTVASQWAGTEAVESTLGMFGSAVIAQVFNEAVTSTSNAVDVISFLHNMISVVESTFNAVDSVTSKADFRPLITESVAIAGTLAVLKTINESVSESPTIEDSVDFGWLESIAESGEITDSAAVQWVAMHVLTESLVATDTAIGLFNFSDTVTETLEAAATVAIQQMLQESITDILNLGITIILDDEVWECWVMNGNRFNFSVYSGFDFNSYATYNNVAYGCKPDGIYRLDGDTDDGAEFKSGIVLPETSFGSSRKKRFRKAYFGISGGSPSIRMETSSGNQTYSIASSKANISRAQYGKDWTLKVQGFDDLSFVELVPIILTRG